MWIEKKQNKTKSTRKKENLYAHVNVKLCENMPCHIK